MSASWGLGEGSRAQVGPRLWGGGWSLGGPHDGQGRCPRVVMWEGAWNAWGGWAASCMLMCWILYGELRVYTSVLCAAVQQSQPLAPAFLKSP